MFWLDLEKPEENEIAETIQDLKDERSFSRAVRQGLRLWVSLRRRDTSVLFELFPWIQDRLQPTTTGNTDNNDSGGQEDQIKALQAKIDMLTDIVTQQGTPGGMIMSARENQLKQLPAGKPAQADFDLTGGMLEVKKATSTENANFNILIASAAMGVCKFEELPPDVLAYGVERGKIPADKLPKVATNGNITKNEKNPGKIAGADMTIITPDFDDLELTI